MKLHILSDLHLEFSDFIPPKTDADVVVLAGDIGKSIQGLVWARKVFPEKEIVYVAGNHEYYGIDISETNLSMRITAIELGIHLLENRSVIIGGTRFIGATLWTDFRLFGYDSEEQALQVGQRGLNDFRIIRDDSNIFTAKKSQELHEISIKYLKHELSQPFSGNTVVVTHHLPSKLSVADRFKHDLLSCCFASNCDDLFGRMDLWVHGHTHDNMDYVSEGTRVVCNPRGYVTRSGTENKQFNEGLVIEL